MPVLRDFPVQSMVAIVVQSIGQPRPPWGSLARLLLTMTVQAPSLGQFWVLPDAAAGSAFAVAEGQAEGLSLVFVSRARSLAWPELGGSHPSELLCSLSLGGYS